MYSRGFCVVPYYLKRIMYDGTFSVLHHHCLIIFHMTLGIRAGGVCVCVCEMVRVKHAVRAGGGNFSLFMLPLRR